MSKNNSNTLELTSIPRNASANRFQVNLVHNDANGETVANEFDDQFDENGVELRSKQRRTSKIQQVIRSSLRTSDSSKKERKESIARFKVSDDNSDSNDEDENLLDGNEYDTKYGRSLRWFFFRYVVNNRIISIYIHILY